MLTSVGCFGGSGAARPVLELLRKPALSRERWIANVRWFAYARVELETMYAASEKIVRLGWLAPAKRVAGSSDLTVTPNSSTFLCSLLFDKICIIIMLERARYNNYFLF